MNMKKNIIVAAAAAMSMAGATAAEAANEVAYTGAAVEFSATKITKTGIGTGPIVSTITAPAGGVTTMNAADSVAWTLGGGAVYEPSTLNLNLPTAADVGGGGAIALTGCALSAGNTVLTCSSAVSGAINLNAAFTWKAAATVDMSAATGNATLAFAVTRTVLGAPSVIYSAATPAVAVNRNAALVKGAAFTAGGNQIATVGNLFQSFNGTTTTNATTGGAVTTTGDAAQAGTATGSFRLTLTGLPTAASSVALTGVAGSLPTGLAASATPVANGFSLDGAGNGYARVVGIAQLPSLAGLVITMDGTTPITVGNPQLAVDYVAAATPGPFAAHGVLAAANVTTITRNGSNISMNMISAGTTVKLTNNDTTGAGSITITAKDAAGAAVAQVGATMPTAIAPGNTVSITGAALMAAFPAAATLDFVIEAGDVTATDIIIVPTVGANVNSIRTAAGSSAM